MGGIESGVSGSTDTVTPGTTRQAYILPDRTVKILFRASKDNTSNVFIKLGQLTATSGDFMLRPGENATFNIVDQLILKKLLGEPVTKEDFMKNMSYIGGAASQTLYIDAFTL